MVTISICVRAYKLLPLPSCVRACKLLPLPSCLRAYKLSPLFSCVRAYKLSPSPLVYAPVKVKCWCACQNANVGTDFIPASLYCGVSINLSRRTLEEFAFVLLYVQEVLTHFIE